MTISQYLTSMPPDRRAMIQSIRRLLRARPLLKEAMGGTAGSQYMMYTFQGHYAYGLANRKDGIRLYSMSMYMHPALKKKYADSLGKFLVGKSCLRFRDAAEIDQQVLRAYIQDVGKITRLKL